MASLIDNITKDIYKNVTRGLFEKDKVLFSFLIATSIGRQAKTLSEELWLLFTRGPILVDKEKLAKNPSKKVFNDRSWEIANYLENNFARFTGIISSFTTKVKLWEAYK